MGTTTALPSTRGAGTELLAPGLAPPRPSHRGHRGHLGSEQRVETLVLSVPRFLSLLLRLSNTSPPRRDILRWARFCPRSLGRRHGVSSLLVLLSEAATSGDFDKDN